MSFRLCWVGIKTSNYICFLSNFNHRTKIIRITDLKMAAMI